jgi:uncharacterized protein
MLFATAAACGLVILVLLVVFRRLLDVALVLAPLLLAGLLMLGYTVIAGSPFNFANVIVLPLLIGLGADSSIHYVMRAREEAGNHEIAETSTPRAVLCRRSPPSRPSAPCGCRRTGACRAWVNI